MAADLHRSRGDRRARPQRVRGNAVLAGQSNEGKESKHRTTRSTIRGTSLPELAGLAEHAERHAEFGNGVGHMRGKPPLLHVQRLHATERRQ